MHVREMVLTFRDHPGPMRIDHRQALGRPRDAAVMFAELLGAETVEVFGMLCLATKYQLLGYYEVSRGSLDSTVVHPRDVLKAAILANAAGVILGHNHPSGETTPSPDDVALTRRLFAAGELVGVAVLDHIITGADGRYFSFKEAGMINHTEHRGDAL